MCYNIAMENPQVRWVEAIPVAHDGREMILLRDSQGITEQSLIISRETALIIALMDGTRSLRDLQADYLRITGEIVYAEQIEELIRALDSHYLLINEHFRAYYSRLTEEYEKEPIRQSCLAGQSYARSSHELAMFLDGMLQAPEAPVLDGEITGILAPHIDYDRGKTTYRDTYRFLKQVRSTLLVILGTCHNYTEKICNISLKDFSTPLGMVTNSKMLGGMIREHSLLKNYVSEWPHRKEHSIELQLPIIQFLKDEDLEVLPILTGSMHEYVEGTRETGDGELDVIVESLKDLLQTYGRPWIIISGADLAHIGAQFGDSDVLSRFTLNDSREKDQTILDRITAVDGEGFLRVIKDEKDRRRVCGLTPIYLQLKLLEGSRCKIEGYEQWTDGKSSVSFAGAVFYK